MKTLKLITVEIYAKLHEIHFVDKTDEEIHENLKEICSTYYLHKIETYTLLNTVKLPIYEHKQYHNTEA